MLYRIEELLVRVWNVTGPNLQLDTVGRAPVGDIKTFVPKYFDRTCVEGPLLCIGAGATLNSDHSSVAIRRRGQALAYQAEASEFMAQESKPEGTYRC